MAEKYEIITLNKIIYHCLLVFYVKFNAMLLMKTSFDIVGKEEPFLLDFNGRSSRGVQGGRVDLSERMRTKVHSTHAHSAIWFGLFYFRPKIQLGLLKIRLYAVRPNLTLAFRVSVFHYKPENMAKMVASWLTFATATLAQVHLHPFFDHIISLRQQLN